MQAFECPTVNECLTCWCLVVFSLSQRHREDRAQDQPYIRAAGLELGRYVQAMSLLCVKNNIILVFWRSVIWIWHPHFPFSVCLSCLVPTGTVWLCVCLLLSDCVSDCMRLVWSVCLCLCIWPCLSVYLSGTARPLGHQSWPGSCCSAWTRSTGSAWTIPTLCRTRARPCSACGSTGRAREPRVSPASQVAPEGSPKHTEHTFRFTFVALPKGKKSSRFNRAKRVEHECCRVRVVLFLRNGLKVCSVKCKSTI